MRITKSFQWLLLAIGFLLLAACESNPNQPATTLPPKETLQFVDLQGFDRDLASALAAPLPKVDVYFYDHITPSGLPIRLQKWMAAVEAGGGSVKVVPPKSSVSPKNPFLLISAISSLWSASQVVKAAAEKNQFKTAHGYDAEIVLKTDSAGQNLVDRVIFSKKNK